LKILQPSLSAKPRNVLIVEDNELDSSQIAKMLDNGELIHIDIAATGKEALELIVEIS
jgi:CheY-like chemotaxis protein